MGEVFGSNAWTAEHSAVLTGLIAAGKSSAEVALAINAQFGTAYTRNSVIGKCARLGLSRPGKPKAAPYVRKKPRQHRERIRIVAGNGDSNHMRVTTTRESADVIKLRCVGIECATTLDDVTGCRYPAGNGPFLFCNGKQQDNSSYCTPHAALCVA